MSEPDNWLKDAPEAAVPRLEPMPYPLTHIEVPVEELDQLRVDAEELAELKVKRAGTRAWAIEQMLAGKRVERSDTLHKFIQQWFGQNGHVLTRCGTYHRTLNVSECREDHAATDWRVVDETECA
jgi:hypothetical protein